MAEGDLSWLPAEVPGGGCVLPPAESSRAAPRHSGAVEPRQGHGVDGLGVTRSPHLLGYTSGLGDRDSAPGDGRGAAGLAVDLRRGRGCPVWGTEMCWAVQWCRPGHEQDVGSWSWNCSSSSSNSLKLFKEAISGRAGNSYHSLLTPGRQERESSSPPHPHRARRAGTTRLHGTPKQGHGVPQGGGHPNVLTPMPTATPNPSGWLCPSQNPWKRAESERH